MRHAMLCATSLFTILVVILMLKVEKNPMTENLKYFQEAHALTKQFEDNPDPEFLKQAYQALENVLLLEEDDPDMRRQLRTDSLLLWLGLIALLDEHLDPDFNPDDVPQLSVQPPPTKEGMIYPPGADPALIDDPKARADYKQAINENQAKTNHYTFQVKLQRLDERITPRAKNFIRNFYTPAAADQEELNKAVNDVIKNAQRKSSVLEKGTF